MFGVLQASIVFMNTERDTNALIPLIITSSLTPMTHTPEIGAENRYRFLTHLACNLVPNFSGSCLW